MKIQIITHTGSDFPLDEAAALGIPVVADLVMFGDNTYRNMYDLTSQEFYAKLEASTVLPTSSHPPVGWFADAICEAAKDADEILIIAVTSKMSGSYTSAITAAELAKERGVHIPVYVFDSLQVSHAMSNIVREAYRLAQEGCTASEIIRALEEYRDKMGMYFVLGSLKYARKGGRVGAIKALAADAMGIKPLLVFTDGVVKDIGIARNFDDGFEKVLDKYKNEADFSKPVTVFHLEAEDKAAILEQKVREINPNAQITTEYVGPVIGIYAGPGGAGLAFEKK